MCPNYKELKIEWGISKPVQNCGLCGYYDITRSICSLEHPEIKNGTSENCSKLMESTGS